MTGNIIGIKIRCLNWFEKIKFYDNIKNESFKCSLI